MKVLFVAGLSILFACAATAPHSPISTVKRMSVMSDDLVDYAKDLMKRRQEPDNDVLRDKVLAMFDSTFSGELLDVWKRAVDEGLSKGWALAYTDDFDWAFPPAIPKDANLRIVRSDSNRAVVEAENDILETFVFESADSIPSLYGHEQMGPKDGLVELYEHYQVNDRPLESYLSEIDDDLMVCHLHTQERTTFFLERVGSSWRIVDMKRHFLNSKLSLES